MQRLQLAVLVLALVAASAAGQPARALSEGLLKDRQALLALKDAVSDKGQSKLGSWRAEGNPCLPKPWPHVGCAGGRVTEINLANRKVAGSLPAKLRLAQALVTLNLDGNKFEGTVPSDWAGKNSFPRLQTLILANNELQGTLPNWNRQGAWRSLRVVDLSSNRFYGGLPNSWLGKHRPLRAVQFVDLSNNNLGSPDGSTPATEQANWCKPEGTGITAGTGWCPDAANTVFAGTTASLITLDLSNNGLVGQIPARWPRIFTRLQYLNLAFNDLHQMVDVGGTLTKVASVLPRPWSNEAKLGFPALSMLTLFPGNEYICSVMAADGSFQDVNLDATYQIADVNGATFTDDNPKRCPTDWVDPTDPEVGLPKPTTAALTEDDLAIEYETTNPIWGFKVSLWAKDAEGEDWAPLPAWSSVFLRVYTTGGDGYDDTAVSSAGLDCTTTAGTCTLMFGSIAPESGLTAPDFTADPTVLSQWKAEVYTVGLNGVLSDKTSSDPVDNA